MFDDGFWNVPNRSSRDSDAERMKIKSHYRLAMLSCAIVVNRRNTLEEEHTAVLFQSHIHTRARPLRSRPFIGCNTVWKHI